jgi:ribonuclease BN (tRNA processing enzyme)
VFVKFYGTRGSVAVSGRRSLHYGGNTTCVRVHSDCLPQGMWLVVDAGTGIVPLSWDFMDAGATSVAILLTHFHHDHTQGLMLTHFPYVKSLPLHIFGPYDRGIGPREVYANLMQPPFFPVHFDEIASHIHAYNVEFANSTALLIHPRGGLRLFSAEELDRSVADNGQVRFESGTYAIDECLVVRMYRSNHPEQTISYRFEERPTGKVFVFVTDHENEASVPARFREHLAGADLLVMDCQYTREKYDKFTAGFGHATPDYVAAVAREVGVRRLGLTHHDPPANDEQIDEIVETARGLLPGVEVFGCYDYIEIEVDRTAVSSKGAS